MHGGGRSRERKRERRNDRNKSEAFLAENGAINDFYGVMHLLALDRKFTRPLRQRDLRERVSLSPHPSPFAGADDRVGGNGAFYGNYNILILR